jgi:hypothetical protein
VPDAPVELRIGVRFEVTDDPGELFADARAVEAAGVDSIWVAARDVDPYVLLAAFAAVTWRVRLIAEGAPYGTPYAVGQETCRRLARGRFVEAEELKENWIHAEFPNSRDIWRTTRRAALDAGAVGIVLPNDPRLIDLLRNPDVDDDRSDLNIAVG